LFSILVVFGTSPADQFSFGGFLRGVVVKGACAQHIAYSSKHFNFIRVRPYLVSGVGRVELGIVDRKVGKSWCRIGLLLHQFEISV